MQLTRLETGRIVSDAGHSLDPLALPPDAAQDAWRVIKAWEFSKHFALGILDRYVQQEVPEANEPTIPPEMPFADVEPGDSEAPLHPVDALELVFRDMDLDVDPARMQRLRAYLDAPQRCYTVRASSWMEIEPDAEARL